MPSNTRIAHLIVRLDTGGAEKSLYRLIRGTRGKLHHHVICFGPRSPIGEDIFALGVEISWLDYKKLGPLVLWRAWRLLREQPPDVLQGWMYFGNLIASMLALLLPRRIKLAWNIRQAPADFSLEKKRTRWTIGLARLPWRAPDLVIYNSYAGQQTHERFGFNRRAHTVIPNGIDLDEFQPSAAARAHWRDEHGVGEQPWVALVCRFHPRKGVGEFLRAVRVLRDTGVNARFALAGPGMAEDNGALLALLADCGVTTAEVDLLGPIADPAAFLPALDLLVIASEREGTPNILLEAMASGVNCVSTRVGDVERILRDPERLVNPGDAADLAEKIRKALAAAPNNAAQQRIAAEREFEQRHYQTEACMAAYLEHYRKLVN